MSTLTIKETNTIREYLEGRHIAKGVGTEGDACSIASINLALTGRLTDEIPACMSPVIGKWIINVQDSMPDDLRNADEWRALLPLAAGTGREKEGERAQIILDWMWETVLPSIQHIADEYGFGEAWSTMTSEKTSAAARAAARAAADAARAAADAAADAAYAAADAADAAADAAYAKLWRALDPAPLLRKLVEA